MLWPYNLCSTVIHGWWSHLASHWIATRPDLSLVTEESEYTIKSCGLLYSSMRSLTFCVRLFGSTFSTMYSGLSFATWSASCRCRNRFGHVRFPSPWFAWILSAGILLGLTPWPESPKRVFHGTVDKKKFHFTGICFWPLPLSVWFCIGGRNSMKRYMVSVGVSSTWWFPVWLDYHCLVLRSVPHSRYFCDILLWSTEWASLCDTADIGTCSIPFAASVFKTDKPFLHHNDIFGFFFYVLFVLLMHRSAFYRGGPQGIGDASTAAPSNLTADIAFPAALLSRVHRLVWLIGLMRNTVSWHHRDQHHRDTASSCRWTVGYCIVLYW